MRAVDEILWALPACEPEGRSFLLRWLGDLPPPPDLGSVLEQLDPLGELPDGAAALRTRWRLEARDLRWRLRTIGGEGAPPEPGWGAGWQPAEPPLEDPDECARLGLLAGEELDVLDAALAVMLAAPGRASREALAALAWIGTPASLERIRQAPAAMLPAPRRLLAYGRHGSPEAGAAARELVEATPAPERASLLPLLGGLPGAVDAALLAPHLRDSPAAVAQALEGAPPALIQELLPAVVEGPDPLAASHALWTLGATPTPEAGARLGDASRPGRDPRLRVVALRALARAGHPEAAALAREALAAGPPEVQAAALEVLGTVEEPDAPAPPELAAALRAAHPRLTMVAALLVARQDPAAARVVLERLLGAPGVEALLRGLHGLAYLDDADAATILGRVFEESPAGPLRLQALREMGCRAVLFPEACFPLARVLEHPDPALRSLAASFLASCHPLARAEVAEILGRRIDREDEDPVARSLVTDLVRLGPAVTRAARPMGNLLAVGGALGHAAAETLCWAIPESEAAAALGGRSDPVLRTLGAARDWSLGRGRVATLGQALEDARGETRAAVVAILGQVAASARWAVGPRRLEGLAGRLRLKEALRCPLPPPAAAPERAGAVLTHDALDAFLEWTQARSRSRGPPPLRPRPLPGRRRPGRCPGGWVGLPAGWSPAPPEAVLRAARGALGSLPAAAPAPRLGLPGLLAALGLLLLLAPRPGFDAPVATTPRSPRPVTRPAAVRRAALPGTSPGDTARARVDEGKRGWDRAVEDLAVQAAVHPTSRCPDFESRWSTLREWLIRELDGGASLLTYTELMQLRFRHLRGDEGTHAVLDELLGRARGMLGRRAVDAELAAVSGGNQGGAP